MALASPLARVARPRAAPPSSHRLRAGPLRAAALGRAPPRPPARALGFDLGESAEDNLRPEVEAQALIEDASSLLLLHESLRTPSAQAYLLLLQHISVKGTPAKVFQAFGAFFRESVAAEGDSFADHVLLRVVAGDDNALAAACAAGRDPSAAEIAAARADLDLLQRVCVNEAVVVRWCERVASAASPARTQPDAWLAAAKSLGDRGRKRETPTEPEPEPKPEPEPDSTDSTELEPEPSVVFARAAPGSRLAAPATSRSVDALREATAQSWAWSSALPRLMAHWRDRGAGAVGRSACLAFDAKSGTLVAAEDHEDDRWENTPTREEPPVAGFPRGDAWRAPPPASVAPLVAHLDAFLEETGGSPPSHVLVHGPPGSGKRDAVRAAVGGRLRDGLRCVRVARSDLKALPALLAACASHPRARFALVLEMPLALKAHAEFHNELVTAMDGGGGGRWPNNATLVAVAPEASGLKPGAGDENGDAGSLAEAFAVKIQVSAGGEGEA